jgi:hypothetical protein
MNPKDFAKLEEGAEVIFHCPHTHQEALGKIVPPIGKTITWLEISQILKGAEKQTFQVGSTIAAFCGELERA